MNKRVKRLWIKALRSRKYRQARGWLRDDGAFCCLGVLCDLYDKQTGTGRWNGHGYTVTNGDSSSTMLPDGVREWAGLDDNLGGDPRLGRTLSASSLNDKGKSFNFIADRIERYL